MRATNRAQPCRPNPVEKSRSSRPPASVVFADHDQEAMMSETIEASERTGAREILDELRTQLDQPGDDVQRLIQLAADLGSLNESRLTSDEAAQWRNRPDTYRERLREILGRQSGFKTGLLIGFAAGTALAGLCGAMLAMHYVVAHQ
jgi:hypothetical protein